MCSIRDDIEKEDAFRGLCSMVYMVPAGFSTSNFFSAKIVHDLHLPQVRANPTGALSSLAYMCKAIASWHVSLKFFSSPS